MITVKELLESADSILKNKLDNMNRMNTVKIPTPEERRRRIADQKKIDDENKEKREKMNEEDSLNSTLTGDDNENV